MSTATSLELEYTDWLCWWWGCVGMGCDSVAASGEVEGSLKWGEECVVPQGSGKLHCQTADKED